MRIRDWSSDVCSSDLPRLSSLTAIATSTITGSAITNRTRLAAMSNSRLNRLDSTRLDENPSEKISHDGLTLSRSTRPVSRSRKVERSEEHTSELQSLMRISYAVFCLKKKNKNKPTTTQLKKPTNTMRNNKHHNQIY